MAKKDHEIDFLKEQHTALTQEYQELLEIQSHTISTLKGAVDQLAARLEQVERDAAPVRPPRPRKRHAVALAASAEHYEATARALLERLAPRSGEQSEMLVRADH